MIMNVWFFKTQWISLPAERLSTSEGEHCRLQLDGRLIIINRPSNCKDNYNYL
jgi:hypothetical protein